MLTRRSPIAWLLAVALAVPLVARADEMQDARMHYEKALAAYGLGNYEDAAAEYEKAFAIKPDPALLYNAAQSHRLGGNKVRALLLYQNYLRLFGNRITNRAEVQGHIKALQRAIDTDQQLVRAQPVEPAPMAPTSLPPSTTPTTAATTPVPTPTAAPATTAPAATSAPATTPERSPDLTARDPAAHAATASASTSATPTEKPPLVRQGWFWGVIAGVVVVAAVAIGLGVGLSGGSDMPPTASFGTATVH